MAMVAVLEPRNVAFMRSMVHAAIQDYGLAVETFSSANQLKEWASRAQADALPGGREAVIVINSATIDDATISLLRDLGRIRPGLTLLAVDETGDPLSLQRALAAGATEVVSWDMDRELCRQRLSGVFDRAARAPSHRQMPPTVRSEVTRLPMLSGLPVLHEEFQQRIAALDGASLAFHLIRIEGLDIVSAAFSSSVGRTLLQACAARLRNIVGPELVVGRCGAGDLAVLQPDRGALHEVESLARQISRQLSVPMLIEGHNISVTAKVGVARFPEDAADYEELAYFAGLAMQQRGQAGGHGVSFFHHDLVVAARKNARLAIELQNALAFQQLYLEYQPQIDLLTGLHVGGEALVRWRRADGSVTPPGDFLPYAEESGLIVGIDEWVLLEACRAARRWYDMGLRLRISVNISARDFACRRIPNLVAHALQKTGLDPTCLDIELTESAVLQDIDRVQDDLARIRALGASISIDDFGVGQSSLHVLRQLNIDRLKIDKGFVRHAATSQNDRIILSAIINLGHSLGFCVVAEGVENAAQLAVLREEGCDEAQGFFFAHPMPADTFVAYAQECAIRVGQSAPPYSAYSRSDTTCDAEAIPDRSHAPAKDQTQARNASASCGKTVASH